MYFFGQVCEATRTEKKRSNQVTGMWWERVSHLVTEERGWGRTGSQINTPLLWHCQRAAHPKQTGDKCAHPDKSAHTNLLG